MKNNSKGDFITELLKSKELNVSQKERIFQLVAKEKDLTVLMEIDLIKEELQSIKDIMSSGTADFDFNEVVITEEMLSMFDDGNVTQMAANKIEAGKFKPDLTINDPIISYNIDDNEKETLGQIVDLRKKVAKVDNSLIVDHLIKNEINNTEYLLPKDLQNFLKEYNQDPILKYTCHLLDDPDKLVELYKLSGKEQYYYEEHLKLIKSRCFKLLDKYKGKIHKNIKALILNYISGPDLSNEKYKNQGWSLDNIKINWSSESLKKWCEENPNSIPNPGENINNFPFDFPEIELNSSGDTIQYFSEIVIHFKGLFHIRKDNSLFSMVETINKQFFIDKVEFQNNIANNIEFFTDVDKLKQAYKKIIEMCIKFSMKNNLEIPKIHLELIEKRSENSIEFKIHHKNSRFGKTARNTIERLGDDFNHLTKNILNGVCDLHLKADFENNEYAEINLWNNMNPQIKKIKKFEGVEFILKF